MSLLGSLEVWSVLTTFKIVVGTEFKSVVGNDDY